MIEIQERLIKQEHWPRKCPILITPRYITIHEMNTWQDAEACAKVCLAIIGYQRDSYLR